MNQSKEEINMMTQMRCPDCGFISLKKDEVSFFCQNPKCKVDRIVGSNLVIIKHLNTQT